MGGAPGSVASSQTEVGHQRSRRGMCRPLPCWSAGRRGRAADRARAATAQGGSLVEIPRRRSPSSLAEEPTTGQRAEGPTQPPDCGRQRGSPSGLVVPRPSVQREQRWPRGRGKQPDGAIPAADGDGVGAQSARLSTAPGKLGRGERDAAVQIVEAHNMIATAAYDDSRRLRRGTETAGAGYRPSPSDR